MHTEEETGIVPAEDSAEDFVNIRQIDGIRGDDADGQGAYIAENQSLEDCGAIIHSAYAQRHLPSYRIGIAVNKAAKEWIGFFEDAYPRLLETNADWITHCYAMLVENLIRFLCGHRDRLIEQKAASAADFDVRNEAVSNWAKALLGLDQIESTPHGQRLWQPILTAVNEFISTKGA